MLRLVGTLSRAARVNVLLTTEVETSTIGDCPLTSTLSSTEPSFMTTSTRALNPTASVNPLRTSVRKPEREYSTRYTPAGRLPSRYAPCPSETMLCLPWSAGLETSTVTPGNAAPVSSVILPNTAPFCTVSWADNDGPVPESITLVSRQATSGRIANDLGLMCPSHI